VCPRTITNSLPSADQLKSRNLVRREVCQRPCSDDAWLRQGDELRANLTLWEAIREYLSIIPEAPIGEMEDFFQNEIGLSEGNRQAESL
jgi:hypothetical protein